MENYSPFVTIAIFALAFIFGTLIVAMIYDIARFFAKPETVQCKEYTVVSKVNEELKFARRCRYCDFYIDPIFRKAFEGDEYKIGLAKDLYLTNWVYKGARPSTSNILEIVFQIRDLVGEVKPTAPIDIEIKESKNGKK